MSLVFSGTAQLACLPRVVVTGTSSDTDPDCRVGPAALTDEGLKFIDRMRGGRAPGRPAFIYAALRRFNSIKPMRVCRNKRVCQVSAQQYWYVTGR